jgi:uncharacterized integral membrane protein
MLGPLGFFLALLLGLGCLYFGIMNQGPVTVTLMPGIPPRSAFVGEIALYSAMVGALVAALLWFPPWLGAHRHVRRLRRRVRELESLLQQSRAGISEAPASALETGIGDTGIAVSRPVAARIDEEPI